MNDFIAYHSAEKMGYEYEHRPGKTFSFLSNKPRKLLEGAIGHRVWVITSSRGPDRRMIYRLAGFYMPSEVVDDEGCYVIRGERGIHLAEPVEVSFLPWFLRLFKEQNRFSYGFSRIRDGRIVDELQRVLDEQAAAFSLVDEEGVAANQQTDFPRVTRLMRLLGRLQSVDRPPTPKVMRKIRRVYELYERPSSHTRFVKQSRGSTCQLCRDPGFLKRNGHRYCEVHHLFHLSKNPPPSCLAPEYLVVLCATCHRRMHYADVGEPIRENGGWRIRVDDSEYHFVTNDDTRMAGAKSSGPGPIGEADA